MTEMTPTPGAWRVLRGTVRGFLDDDALSFSAALSFYTLLSFAPLMVLAVWASTSIGHGAQDALLSQIDALGGNEAANVARSIVDNAEDRPSLGKLSGLASIGLSLLAATTVFAQLQQSLNRIWGIEARPGNAAWAWVRRRILSIGVIAAIVFVAVVSLAFSAFLGLFLTQGGWVWDALNQAITALVYTGLFALLFRYLPDARLPFRDALRGGFVTALLFTAGKALIGWYLSSGRIGGAYGAAASVVLMMVWVYYASAIFFLGAEFVQASVNVKGRRIQANEVGEDTAPVS